MSVILIFETSEKVIFVPSGNVSIDDPEVGCVWAVIMSATVLCVALQQDLIHTLAEVRNEIIGTARGAGKLERVMAGSSRHRRRTLGRHKRVVAGTAGKLIAVAPAK